MPQRLSVVRILSFEYAGFRLKRSPLCSMCAAKLAVKSLRGLCSALLKNILSYVVANVKRRFKKTFGPLNTSQAYMKFSKLVSVFATGPSPTRRYRIQAYEKNASIFCTFFKRKKKPLS